MIKKLTVILIAFFMTTSIYAIGFHTANEIQSGTFSGIYNFTGDEFFFGNSANQGNLRILPYGINDIWFQLYNDAKTGNGNRFIFSGYQGGGNKFSFNVSSGNFGIGTITPQNRLEIVGNGPTSTRFLRVRDTAGDSRILIDSAATGASDSAIDFYAGGIMKGTIKWKENDGTDGGINMYPIGVSTALFIANQTGYVGIGTKTPARRLAVQDASSSGFVSEIYNTATGTSADGLFIRLGVGTPSGGNNFIEFRNGSNNRIGVIQGDSVGGILYTTNSDRRLKKDIENITNAIETINQIRPVTFKFKNQENTSIGFIAQELKPVYPYAVSGDENSDPTIEPMAVDYSKLTPILVAAIQEQQKQIKELKQEINQLKNS